MGSKCEKDRSASNRQASPAHRFDSISFGTPEPVEDAGLERSQQSEVV